jgi:hypothetical protein
MKQETLEEAQKQQFDYDNLHDAKEISSRIKVVETLEEAAKRLCGISLSERVGFYKCFDWQQERSYSEEEVIAFGEFIFKNILLVNVKGVEGILEQFKKK